MWALALAVAGSSAWAQNAATPPAGGQTAAKPPAPPPPDSIPKDQWEADATEQESIGHVRKLRGDAWVENFKMLFQADAMDWDESSGDMHASGHVHMHNFESKEDIWC